MTFDRRSAMLGAGASLLAANAVKAQPRLAYSLRQGKLFVPVTVNGLAAEAVIDSGADVSGIDVALARQAGVGARGVSLLRGVQRLSVGRSGEAAFAVGGPSAQTARVVIVDYAAALDQPIQAVLGRDLLARFVVDLDFDAGTVGFVAPDAFVPPAGALAYPLEAAQGGRPVLRVEVGGGALSALVDTANDQPLIISPQTVRRLRLLEGRTVSTAALGGYGADFVAQIATTPLVRLGGAELRNVPFLAAARSLGVEANLGLPLIARFRTALDLGRRRIWLAPRNAFLAAPFPKDLTGLSGQAEGERFRIDHVARGGPAERAGFRRGDIVLSVDGQPPATTAIGRLPPGTVVVFVMQGGQTRRLTLAEYY